MADNINLDNFKSLKFSIDMKTPIEKYSSKCQQIVKALSPDGNRKAKKYRDGWVVDLKEDRNGIVIATIWNKDNYQLTHLLENGHLIVNKKDGTGWASAKPHIEKAYQQVKEPFIQAMKDIVIKQER